jgi:3-oxoacyl-[acyl-carrier protein] reductase
VELDGKVAIVTGGGRGIGKSIALALAREGADVGVTARTQAEIEQVAEEIRAIGRKAIAVPCDVTDLSAVEAAVATAASELGRIDILVNNAGGGEERTRVGDDDPDAWRHVIEVNLLGTYYFSRAALPYLKKSGGGTIINVGSGMGHQARATNSSYNASKAAVWMFTRCLATEVWEDKITVNELIPGPVATELTAALFQQDAPHPTVPSEYVKGPDDVAPLALYLAKQGPNGPTAQSFSLARRPL